MLRILAKILYICNDATGKIHIRISRGVKKLQFGFLYGCLRSRRIAIQTTTDKHRVRFSVSQSSDGRKHSLNSRAVTRHNNENDECTSCLRSERYMRCSYSDIIVMRDRKDIILYYSVGMCRIYVEDRAKTESRNVPSYIPIIKSHHHQHYNQYNKYNK